MIDILISTTISFAISYICDEFSAVNVNVNTMCFSQFSLLSIRPKEQYSGAYQEWIFDECCNLETKAPSILMRIAKTNFQRASRNSSCYSSRRLKH